MPLADLRVTLILRPWGPAVKPPELLVDHRGRQLVQAQIPPDWKPRGQGAPSDREVVAYHPWLGRPIEMGGQVLPEEAGAISPALLFEVAIGRGRLGAVGPSCVQLYAALCRSLHSRSCKCAEFLTAPASS